MSNAPKICKVFVLSGPSGVGKGTICQNLIKNFPYPLALSVSATSRDPRPGEKEGVAYFFKTGDEFEDMICDPNALLEWAEYNGRYYGTPRAYVEQHIKKGVSVLLEIETKGAMQVRQKMPEASLILIEPPSIEILEERLRGRKTNTERQIKDRMVIATRELAMKPKFDVAIINDDLTICCEEVRTYMLNELKRG